MTDQLDPVAPPGTANALTVTDHPRIYVACLAAYNNGRLHGAWIDATTPEEIRAAVRAMLAASPEPDAEEWVIHGATRKSHLLSEAGMPL
ncbi:antirestriction protein ArdA, partial [uncultured Hyphomonas sp.]|uniref:antirestriction protein ArdA n=1 Tax=uncultured Hyphomonas sp. TaxID=225298 RepID=UPI0030DC2E88